MSVKVVVDTLGVSPTNRKKLTKIAQSVKLWAKRLKIDPMWTIYVGVSDGGEKTASIDIGIAEYFLANLNVSEYVFELDEKEFNNVVEAIGCHELIHIVTADYQRTALLIAGDNQILIKELNYRYEQFVTKMTATLTEAVNENRSQPVPLSKSDDKAVS